MVLLENKDRYVTINRNDDVVEVRFFEKYRNYNCLEKYLKQEKLSNIEKSLDVKRAYMEKLTKEIIVFLKLSAKDEEVIFKRLTYEGYLRLIEI